MRMILPAALIASLTFASAPMAQAKTPLGEVEKVSNGLLAVGIADEIRKTCPSISARMLTALSVVNGIKRHAESLGYSADEIRAYRRSDVEKRKLRARGEAYLKANGVVSGDPETYCALGRAEIEKSSQIGALLRAK